MKALQLQHWISLWRCRALCRSPLLSPAPTEHQFILELQFILADFSPLFSFWPDDKSNLINLWPVSTATAHYQKLLAASMLLMPLLLLLLLLPGNYQLRWCNFKWKWRIQSLLMEDTSSKKRNAIAHHTHIKRPVFECKNISVLQSRQTACNTAYHWSHQSLNHQCSSSSDALWTH